MDKSFKPGHNRLDDDSESIDFTMHRGARFLEVAESGLYLIAGYILMVAAAGLLLSALIDMIPVFRERDFPGAVILLLDRLLLVLMMAELTFTVRRIAHTRQLEVTSFLVIAIIASVRRMLVITVEYASIMDLDSPVFRAFLAEMVMLSILTLFLAVSIYLIRRTNNATTEH